MRSNVVEVDAEIRFEACISPPCLTMLGPALARNMTVNLKPDRYLMGYLLDAFVRGTVCVRAIGEIYLVVCFCWIEAHAHPQSGGVLISRSALKSWNTFDPGMWLTIVTAPQSPETPVYGGHFVEVIGGLPP
jgi:hypothetical protein